MSRTCGVICVLLAVCMAMPAAHGQEVLLPDSPETVCTRETMLEATSKGHECAKTLYYREDPVESCCRMLAEYYGPQSTLPSRNCFCVESYWSELLEYAKVNRVRWSQYFDGCMKMGFPIWYYKDGGKGPCNAGNSPASPADMAPAPAPANELAIGFPPAPAPAMKAAVDQALEKPVLPMRNFSAWVKQLHSDGWGLASFIAAVFAVMGSGVMAWSFMFDACADIRKCWSKAAKGA